MMKMLLSLVRSYKLAFVIIGAMVFLPVISQAKDGDDQDQIILLNDSAAALEDSNPDISKSLTKFADEKEKIWEDKNANKDTPAAPLTDKSMAQIQKRIELLKSAAVLIEPTYPLIAKALKQMAKDMNRTIELEN